MFRALIYTLRIKWMDYKITKHIHEHSEIVKYYEHSQSIICEFSDPSDEKLYEHLIEQRQKWIDKLEAM